MNAKYIKDIHKERELLHQAVVPQSLEDGFAISETGWVERECGPRLEAKSCRNASRQRRKGREGKTGTSSRS